MWLIVDAGVADLVLNPIANCRSAVRTIKFNDQTRTSAEKSIWDGNNSIAQH